MDLEWPALPYAAWQDTCATLHRYSQIVGKIRLALTPLVNHYWNVALHPTARGLTTRPMTYDARSFEIDLDFLAHRLVVRASDGATGTLALAPRPVAEFHRELMALLAEMNLPVTIDDRPVEILTEAIPFTEDRLHASYDREMVSRFWRVLASSVAVFEEFRARFIGKASPVHFFWGSFDLAASRYSGRRAPPRPNADRITHEAYSHEVSSGGFWPGDARFPEPSYYAYLIPTPDGLAHARVQPSDAFWHRDLGEHLLPYEAVRSASRPREALLAFLQSCYEAGAELAGWDRAELERDFARRAAASEEPAAPPLH